MRMISGKRYWGDDHEVGDVEEARKFREIIKELVPLGGANNLADFMPILRWLNYDHSESKLKSFAKRVDGFLQGLIEEHRNEKQRANTMIDHLLSLQESQPEYYTDQIIKGLILARYNVPRGTMVLVNAWAIHRDPQLWSDATSFKPERFEKEGEANKLIPFGLGRRTCPGAGLAQRTVGMTLGLLIQCFEWNRVSEEDIDMTEGSGLSMPKVIPLEAMCKARHPIIYKL